MNFWPRASDTGRTWAPTKMRDTVDQLRARLLHQICMKCLTIVLLGTDTLCRIVNSWSCSEHPNTTLSSKTVMFPSTGASLLLAARSVLIFSGRPNCPLLFRCNRIPSRRLRLRFDSCAESPVESSPSPSSLELSRKLAPKRTDLPGGGMPGELILLNTSEAWCTSNLLHSSNLMPLGNRSGYIRCSMSV